MKIMKTAIFMKQIIQDFLLGKIFVQNIYMQNASIYKMPLFVKYLCMQNAYNLNSFDTKKQKLNNLIGTIQGRA